MNEETKTYKEGYFIVLWLAIVMLIFSVIGFPLCLATNNPGLIGIGPARGGGLGLAIGQSMEYEFKKLGRNRQLTNVEMKEKII